ncbi:restriction endonuclease subunit S [Serratia sp. JSRIV002]|uniref:restriction endonuclease subunit S n=1 Tax=Serratia sp. JSRIV002 TaxID=2831894 RepID=UPI001CBBB412|nr:restriction endonuclease subunit S [Serratia sp. JSRIV002]UAN51666.1 restriction endonuclease subunit S [Serratia sp. JSRIV002]
MSFEWRAKKLGDIITLQRGHDLPSQERKIGHVPIMGSSGVTGYHNQYKAKGPGVIIGRSGNSMGQISYVSENYWPLNTSLYITDFKGNCPEFIYYFLKQINFDQFNSGSAQKSLNRNAVYPFEVKFPSSYKTQSAIASILFSLEQKIKVNHQINQTLEQIAQALFKSWFVDFEPVKAKIAALEKGGTSEDATLEAMTAISSKDTAALAVFAGEHPEKYVELKAMAELFPSTMQESERGKIPQGWEVTTFGAVSNCLDKYRIPLAKNQREKIKGSIPYYGATSIMDYVNEHIFNGVYLLLGEDGSVLKDDGTPFTQYIWGEAWVNNHAHVLQGKNGISTEQLLLFMKNQNLAPYVTGAVQLKLNQKNMNSIPFIKSDEKISLIFNTLIEPIFCTFRKRHDESISLCQIRDTLLPKLFSGSICVEDGA